MTINAPGRTRLSQRERWALVARLIAGKPITWDEDGVPTRYCERDRDYYNRLDNETARYDVLGTKR